MNEEQRLRSKHRIDKWLHMKDPPSKLILDITEWKKPIAAVNFDDEDILPTELKLEELRLVREVLPGVVEQRYAIDSNNKIVGSVTVWLV